MAISQIALLIVATTACVVQMVSGACDVVTFNNGSKTNLASTPAATNYAFPGKLRQTGVAAGLYSWSISLCDKNANVPKGGSACAGGAFLSLGDCATVWNTMSKKPTPTDDGRIQIQYLTSTNLLAIVNLYCGSVATPYIPAIGTASGDGEYSYWVGPGTQVNPPVTNEYVFIFHFFSSAYCPRDGGRGGGGGGSVAHHGKGLTPAEVALIVFIPLVLIIIGIMAWNCKSAGRSSSPSEVCYNMLSVVGRCCAMSCCCRRGGSGAPWESSASASGGGGGGGASASAGGGGYTAV